MGAVSVGPGYQVVLQDLTALAATFRRESAACRAVMPPDGPVCPDGGDAAVNGALQALTGLIALANLQVAGAMEEHAVKLTTAEQVYEQTETSLEQMVTDLTARAGLD